MALPDRVFLELLPGLEVFADAGLVQDNHPDSKGIVREELPESFQGRYRLPGIGPAVFGLEDASQEGVPIQLHVEDNGSQTNAELAALCNRAGFTLHHAVHHYAQADVSANFTHGLSASVSMGKGSVEKLLETHCVFYVLIIFCNFMNCLLRAKNECRNSDNF